jgi:molecular chaperone GrpE
MNDRGTHEDRAKSGTDADRMSDADAGTGEGGDHARDEVTALRAEIESLRREADDKHDRMLRALADADNARRRAQRDREDYLRYANESFLRELIPVLDNLDRALDAARAADNAANVIEGVELIKREFLRVLERAGVTRYSAIGQPFDPTRHEAFTRIVSAQAPPDTVVAETAPGYVLNGRVLRPAMVAVAAAPDEDTAG